MFLFCKHFTQLLGYFSIILDKGWFSDIIMTISSCPHHCTCYWFSPLFSEITITSVLLISLQCNWNTNSSQGTVAWEQFIKYARYCDTTSIKNSIPQLGLNHSEQHRCRTDSVLWEKHVICSVYATFFIQLLNLQSAFISLANICK